VLRLHIRSGPGEPAHEGRSAPDDDLDALRALCAALWDEAASSVPDDGQADRSGRLAQIVDLHVGVDADGDDMRSRQAAADVLARLGLT
jgi:hypothetical protein